jgi:hypothetical protein
VTEQPFIYIFASSERWMTHSNGTWDTNEKNYLNFNADGGPPIPLAD